MTAQRITQRLMVERSMYSLQSGLGRLATSQEKLSTGRSINRPSDDPTGTNAAMRLRAALAAGDQHARNVEDGSSWLGTADNALTSMLDSVRQARELVQQGLSTGSAGPDARAALARQIDEIRSAVLADANTSYLGRPVFGGTTAGSVAYAADGSFVGDRNPVTRTVGPGDSVTVNVVGPDAFATADDDLFTALADAADLVRNDPAAAGAALDRLDALSARMRDAQTVVGTRAARLETVGTQLTAAALADRTALSDIEDVDVAEAIMDVQMQEVAYQAALGATARVLQPSLIDFLR